MKTLLLSFLITVSAFAQSPFTSTTFGAAASRDHQQIVVASTTGIGTGTELFAGQEAMLVNDVIGNTLTVQAGVDGTRSASHLSGETIYIALPSAFRPRNPEGTCSLAASTLPQWIYPAGAGLWSCTSGVWQPFNGPGRPVTPDAVTGIVTIGTTVSIDPAVGVTLTGGKKFVGDGSLLTGTGRITAACTVASLPVSPSVGQQCFFSDALTVTDCTAGGGTAKSFCVYNGSIWVKP